MDACGAGNGSCRCTAYLHNMVRFYHFCRWRDNDAFDVVRTLGCGRKDIERDADHLPFHLTARIHKKEHPVFKLMMLFVSEKAYLELLSQTLQHSSPIRNWTVEPERIREKQGVIGGGRIVLALCMWRLRQMNAAPITFGGHSRADTHVRADGDQAVTVSEDLHLAQLRNVFSMDLGEVNTVCRSHSVHHNRNLAIFHPL